MMEGQDEAIRYVNDRLEKLKTGRSIYFAAKETQVQVANRVWGQGKLTNGSALKYNEDYELYAYQPPSPKKVTGKGKPYKLWKRPPPKGVKGRSAAIKGGWYPSYLAYKQQQGRADAPFELTGRLRKAYLSDISLKETGATTTLIVLSGENASKYEGLTDSKGEFLQLSDEEIKYYNERVNDLSQ
jgi:hypothetical protein